MGYEMAISREKLAAFEAEANQLVNKIGEIIGAPVELVRIINGKWSNGLDLSLTWINAFSVEQTEFKQYGIRRKDASEYDRIRGRDAVTQFWLMHFPGCCALAISTAVNVNPLYRLKGINTIGNKLRQVIAKASGYTTLICTDIETNTGERKTLEKNGWKDIYSVNNRRTNHQVRMSYKELWEPGED